MDSSPPTLLNALKPLTTDRPRRRSRFTSIRPTPHPVLATKRDINVNLNASHVQSGDLNQSTSVNTDLKAQVPSSKLTRFMRRISMNLLPSEQTLTDSLNGAEKKNNSQLDFSTWKRRKSSMINRDMSPLCLQEDPQTSEEVPEVKENTLAGGTANCLSNRRLETVQRNSTMCTKRKSSLTRWFEKNVKHPRRSLPHSPPTTTCALSVPIDSNKLSIDAPVENTVKDTPIGQKSITPNTRMFKSRRSLLRHRRLARDTVITSKSQETKASRDSSIQKVDPPTDCDNLVRSKEVKSENITLLNKENEELVKPDVNTNGNKPTFGSVGRIVEQGDAWFIIPPTGIDGPYSQNQNGTYSSISSIVSDFPSMSHSVGRSNGSSKSLLSTFYTPTMKRRQRLPIPSEFLNSATLGTVSSKPPTPSKDGIGRVPTTNLQSEVNRSSDQDSGLSSQLSAPLHAIDMESQNEDYLPKVVNNNPTEISSATRWTTTLRQSMKRANNRRILLAGCTIFNRNPVEGINYLIRNYTLVSNPSKIAHFLLNEPNLNRQAIGEYFGLLDNPMATKVLKEFLLLIDMKGMEVDNALRSVIGHFHPSGESQKIAHLMQIFQEVYIHQNPDRVHRLFRNSETVEVLAYSVLLLHTDLHNPNVGKMGKRMTKQGFINNNRGIDSNHDVSKDLLEGIYDRVAASEFKTLPDPSDRLRALDGVLVGPLKTDNFVQRHRRFIGRVLAQQIEKIAPRRLPSKNNSRWRYLLIFNDILLVVKSLSSTRLRSDSLMNTAAAVAMGDQNVSRHYTPRNSISSVRNQNPKDQSGNVRSRSSSGVVQDVAQKIFCSTEPFVSDTSYQVRNVFPFLDLRVLVFESNYYRYGVQLCNSSGPVISLNMSSETCRRQFIDWVYESIAEMEELQQHQQMKQTVCEKNIIIKSGLNSSNTSIVREDNSSSVSSSSMKKKVILSNP